MPAHYPNTDNAILVSTNLSMISLFSKTFLRLLHDMPTTVEMFKTGYPKVL